MSTQLCDYGCGQEAIHQFKNGKWCCSNHYTQCPTLRNKFKQKIPWNKNKHISEEHKLKIKINHKRLSGKENGMFGKKHSLEAIEKIRETSNGKTNGMYGKKHSNETCMKISRSCKEVLNTPEVKKKLIKCNTGENNPNWKGGIAYEPYCDAWGDPQYKESIKERDGHICLNPMCSSGKILSIHHIDYNKKNCHPSNLITICISCNSKANFNREWYEEWYKRILNRRYNYE